MITRAKSERSDSRSIFSVLTTDSKKLMGCITKHTENMKYGQDAGRKQLCSGGCRFEESNTTIEHEKSSRHVSISSCESYEYFVPPTKVKHALKSSFGTRMHRSNEPMYLHKESLRPKMKNYSKADQSYSESENFSQLSYNWVDTRPTVVSLNESVEFEYNKNRIKGTKSDSDTETFYNYDDEIIPRRIKAMKKKSFKNSKRIKHRKNKKLTMNKSSRMMKVNSITSYRNTTKQLAMINLYNYFEELLETTLNSDYEADQENKDTLSQEFSANGSSINTLLQAHSTDNIQSNEENVETESNNNLKTNNQYTIEIKHSDILKPKELKVILKSTPRDVEHTNKTKHKDILKPKEMKVILESLPSDVNDRDGKDIFNFESENLTQYTKKSSKQKQKHVFGKKKKHYKHEHTTPDTRSRSKLKRRRKSSGPKRLMLSLLKKELNEKDNGKSQFFQSLKNIADLKNRISQETHFYNHQDLNVNGLNVWKHKCSLASRKLIKNNARKILSKNYK